MPISASNDCCQPRLRWAPARKSTTSFARQSASKPASVAACSVPGCGTAGCVSPGGYGLTKLKCGLRHKPAGWNAGLCVSGGGMGRFFAACSTNNYTTDSLTADARPNQLVWLSTVTFTNAPHVSLFSHNSLNVRSCIPAPSDPPFQDPQCIPEYRDRGSRLLYETARRAATLGRQNAMCLCLPCC